MLNKRVQATALAIAIASGLFSLAPVVSAQSTTTLSWTKPPHNASWPGANAYSTLYYDPFSQQTLYYGILPTATGIYSTDLFSYNARTNTWTHLGGTGSPTDNCNNGSASSIQPWPSDRHPSGQMAIDTKRHVLWLYGGVCSTVAQTNGIWKLSLNADPTQDRWTKLATVTTPYMYNLFQFVYDSDDDVIFSYGFNGSIPQNWLYCPTDLNPTPGTLTAKQTAAGCVRPDDWNQVTPVGITSTVDCGAHQPCGWSSPGIVYDTVTRTAILFGGQQGGIYKNETWVYDVPTHTWTQKALTGSHPTVSPQFPAYTPWAYNTNDHKVYLHVTAPSASDWAYDPVADQWTQLSSTGTGGTIADQTMAYDASVNSVVAWYQGFVTTDIWMASFGSGTQDTTPPSVPTGLLAHAVSASEIDLSWTASTDNIGVAGYNILRNGVQIATTTTTTATSYANTGLSGNTTYTYTVSAFDAAGNTSAQSASASATTSTGSPDTTPPSVPTGLTASAVSSSAINLSWPASTDNVGVAGYNIFRNAVTIASVTSLTYFDTGLSPSTTYSYTVSAYDGSGNQSAQSPAVSVTTSANVTSGATITSLTIQEAIYPGSVPGITRTQDPLTVGLPLADTLGITSESQLGLSGAAVGQFRILGRWPSGNAKWVLVDTLADIAAGGQNASISLTRGGGNFGGGNLATDNGPTITVNTGPAQFTVKKANFNVIDQAVVNGKTIVASGTSQGLVITGPNPTTAFPANVTCGTGTGQSPCTTQYSSANDPNATCSIEENGPVKSVVRCIGNHMDIAGHPYMQYTARLYFYKGRTNTKISSVLRNANYDTSTQPSPDCNWNPNSVACIGQTYNTAYKGFQSYEIRITPNLTGTVNYSIATDASPQTGSLSTSDAVSIYQGQSQTMINQEAGDPTCLYQSLCANSYTTDTGFRVTRNGINVVTGSATQYPQGWADEADSTGAGVEIGIYNLAAQWPASLEFNGGGRDVRIGMFSAQNSQPVYQAWPAWSIHEVYLNFHDAAVSSPANEFLKVQHYLLARAPYTYYNAAAVFPYSIVDPVVEDNYYLGLSNTANPSILPSWFCWNGAPPCTPDRDVKNPLTQASAMNVSMTRNYYWGAGGPLNQEEFRWGDIIRFLQRGQTGRYVNSSHFYWFEAEKAWPHDDGTSSSDRTVNGFNWRDRTHAGKPYAELDSLGNPRVGCGGSTLGGCTRSTNSNKAPDPWVSLDQLHMHWYGITDYYFLSGDETIKEGTAPMKNYYMNMDTYQGSSFGGEAITRAVGLEMIATARFSSYLKAIGDPDAATVLNQGVVMYNASVKPDVCLSGQPAGCTPPPVNNYASPGDPVGINRARGVHLGSRSSGWCPHATAPNYVRTQVTFMTSILIEGLLSLRDAMGPSWPDYNTALDLAYGQSQWALIEAYNDDGTNAWQTSTRLYNGFRHEVAMDTANVCPSMVTDQNGYTAVVDGVRYDTYSFPGPEQGEWFNFYVQYLMNGDTSWERKMKIALDQVAYHKSIWPADFGSLEISLLINAVKNPTQPVLTDVPFTVTAGAGSYTLTWTVPANAQSYRIKWSNKAIAPSSGLLNFDNLNTNSFGLSPGSYTTWFAANNVTEPAPSAAGTVQTVTISTGISGLTASNFSLKAYVSRGGATAPPPPGPATTLALGSGNGQSGPAGKPLTNAFTVKATDANGNPAAGVLVNFNVAAGGGRLSLSTVATDSNGFASSTLTLGPTPGTNTVTAASGTLAGSPITFTATGTAASAGPPSNLVFVSGNNQTGAAGQVLASPFIVKVTDAIGTPVSGTNVTFTVTAGGGTMSARTVATDSNGLASSTLTLGSAAGTNTVTAVSGTLAGSPITFTASGTVVTAGPAANLVLVSGNNQTGTPGQPLSSPLVVKVTDANGTPVSGTPVTFVVTAGGGTLSAATVATDSNGLASSTLTLGTTAGAATVTVSAGNLSGSPVTFTATGVSSVPGSSTVTWSQPAKSPGWPGGNGYLVMRYDPVSTQTILYGVPAGSTSGPSSDFFFYNSTLNLWTHLGGTGAITSQCTPNTPTQPGERQIMGQMAVDTTRNVLWLYGGTCSGNVRRDTYYLTLSANPMNDVWHQVTTAHFPVAAIASSMIYDPDDDVLFAYGYDGGAAASSQWIYCRTAENPLPGTPTAKQSTAGCITGDDWNEINHAASHPSASRFVGLIYDPVNRKALLYGGRDGGSTPYNETWTYDIPSHTWSRKCQVGCVAPPLDADPIPFPVMAYNPGTQKVLLHQTSGVGAPADWQYDPAADTWSKLISAGIPPQSNMTMVLDTAQNKLIGWSQSSAAQLWQGTLSSSSSPCDLNGDGLVNDMDVQLGIQQALGSASCGTADLNGDGKCDIIDVQRIINASLTGVCRVGPS